MGVKRWFRRDPGRASLWICAALMAALIGILSVTAGGKDVPIPGDTPPVTTAPPTVGKTSPSGTQSSQSVSPSPPVVTSAATPDQHGEHRRPDARPVQQTTVSYLTTFLDAKIPDATWRARLNALSTATHRETLATVPRAVVPRVGLRAVTVTRLASSAAAAEGVLTDGTALVVALVLDGDGNWKVSRVVPKVAGP